MPTTGKAMITTIQAIREAGSRCGRKITRAITARWIRKSRSAPSVEKNEYPVILAEFSTRVRTRSRVHKCSVRDNDVHSRNI